MPTKTVIETESNLEINQVKPLEKAVAKLKKNGVTVRKVTRKTSKNPEKRVAVVNDVPININHVLNYRVTDNGKVSIVTTNGKHYVV